MGWIGGGGWTPHLDALAAAGVRFPAAVAAAPLTLPSHASIFSGLVPRRHGVHDNGQVLGSAVPLLAERLRSAGYATAAFVSGYPLQAMFGLQRGFDHYDDRLTAGEGAWLERPAEETTAAALAWIATAPGPGWSGSTTTIPTSRTRRPRSCASRGGGAATTARWPPWIAPSDRSSPAPARPRRGPW